jgi:hypothetical protein
LSASLIALDERRRAILQSLQDMQSRRNAASKDIGAANTIAYDRWGMYRRHPWLLDVPVTRPAIGPNVADRYEYELSAVDGIGLDALQMNAAYATLRIMIWAIPILGFLGTVIGITMAISSLKPEAFATEAGIETLTASLGVRWL